MNVDAIKSKIRMKISSFYWCFSFSSIYKPSNIVFDHQKIKGKKTKCSCECNCIRYSVGLFFKFLVLINVSPHFMFLDNNLTATWMETVVHTMAMVMMTSCTALHRVRYRYRCRVIHLRSVANEKVIYCAVHNACVVSSPKPGVLSHRAWKMFTLKIVMQRVRCILALCRVELCIPILLLPFLPLSLSRHFQLK